MSDTIPIRQGVVDPDRFERYVAADPAGAEQLYNWAAELARGTGIPVDGFRSSGSLRIITAELDEGRLQLTVANVWGYRLPELGDKAVATIEIVGAPVPPCWPWTVA